MLCVQVVIAVTLDGAPVTSFEAGEMYDIEVPAYSGTANNWIHASAGEMAPADPAAGFTATVCPEAAHSGQIPAATHMYIWTAPATTEDVTISAAQATGPSDNYHTATVRPRLALRTESPCDSISLTNLARLQYWWGCCAVQ